MEWGATASCCTPAFCPEKFISDRRPSRPRGSSPACPRGEGTCSPHRGAFEPGRPERNIGRSACKTSISECKTGRVEPPPGRGERRPPATRSAAWSGVLRRAAGVRGGTACCSEAIFSRHRFARRQPGVCYLGMVCRTKRSIHID